MNFLEHLAAEWFEYSGSFVRSNVRTRKRAKGGYDCELDVLDDGLLGLALEVDGAARRQPREALLDLAQDLLAGAAEDGAEAAVEAELGVHVADEVEPVLLTSFLLRPTMHGTQRRFLASECSTYLGVRLRAPRVENATGHRASPSSRRNPARSAGIGVPEPQLGG